LRDYYERPSYGLRHRWEGLGAFKIGEGEEFEELGLLYSSLYCAGIKVPGLTYLSAQNASRVFVIVF
jgi:hypothetical protein